MVKLLLEHYFPEIYTDLTDSEEPDIQATDGSVGIEVVTAISNEHAEDMSNYLKAYNEDNEEKKKTFIKKMGKHGEKYMGGIQVWKNMPCSINEVNNLINKKIKKFDNYNKKFDVIDLCINGIYTLPLFEPEYNKLISLLKTKISNKEIPYRYVFVMTINKIIKVDTKSGDIVEISFNEKYVSELATKAEAYVTNNY